MSLVSSDFCRGRQKGRGGDAEKCFKQKHGGNLINDGGARLTNSLTSNGLTGPVQEEVCVICRMSLIQEMEGDARVLVPKCCCKEAGLS